MSGHRNGSGPLAREDWIAAPSVDFQKANPGWDKRALNGEANLRILTGRAFMATFEPPDYIIDGIVQRGRLYACTSLTGHGKTAVWLHLGCMLAAGRNIGRLEIAQGNVVILSGENPADLCGRLHAACHAYHLDPDRLPHVLPGNFPLTPESALKLRDEIDAMGINPVLIVPDTAAAYFPGDNDNDNVQMGAYGRTLRTLTECKGHPAVMVISHPVKNGDRDHLLPRGGGGYLNELDGNLTLWSDALGESTTLHWQGKLRGADFAPLPFRLRTVTVEGLLDAKGRPFVSIVAEVQSQEAADDARQQAVGDENAVLRSLAEQPGISIAAIARNAGWASEGDVPNKAKVHRCLEQLKQEKLVRLYRRKWTITDAGKAEIKGKDE